MEDLPKNARVLPISVVNDPILASAETCSHVRSLLLTGEYNLSEQMTDIGLEFNYFQRKSRDFNIYQRMQEHYAFERYFRADQMEPKRPSFQVHVLCGEGRFFSGLRQSFIELNLLSRPLPEGIPLTGRLGNGLSHAEALFFEAIGSDTLKLHKSLVIDRARDLPDKQSVSTRSSLIIPIPEVLAWIRDRNGPCTLKHFLKNKNHLSQQISIGSTYYHHKLVNVLKEEWNPYLAGMFIYACRLQLTSSDARGSQRARTASKQTGTSNQCRRGDGEDGDGATDSATAAAAAADPSGDCT
ncbi:hypothetical protein I4U23_029838 [Adineta vaga]|nr:hypothetical protein I4U23_029838 [Adineta vaga]